MEALGDRHTVTAVPGVRLPGGMLSAQTWFICQAFSVSYSNKDCQYDYVQDEISAVVKAAKGRTVKVIIETCLLTDEEKKIATVLSCKAGADFVKTSTGFSTGGATASDVALMKKYCTEGVLVKASAGIRSLDDAVKMIEAGADCLGTSAGVSIVSK